METISRTLLTFVLNSLWQIPLAVVVAALACRFLKNAPARHRHIVWVATLAAAFLLPLASIRTVEPEAAPQFDAALAAPGVASVNRMPEQVSPITPPPSSPAKPPRTISFGSGTAAILIGIYLLFVLIRLTLLLAASIRTVQIRRTAHAAVIPQPLESVWNRCRQAFGLTEVDLLFSAQVSGPVSAGRTIILPESLLNEASEEVLTTATGHEMAHIARHDFSFNLLYELLHVPIGFHPAAWLIRSGIERTREIASDELVTARLIDAGVYARSIVTIATRMTAMPRPGYTLGVFDGDILEERIRRLVERPAVNLRRARLLLVTGLSALALCGVFASSLAITARAQGGATAFLKQAEVAVKGGDYRQAVEQLQTAIRIEPRNLKAKVLLAQALLAQYIPGTDPANPLVTAARQQYLDVVAQEPGNKEALRGMLNLLTSTKQHADAHQWALRAIQADATDKIPYYTAAFVDWAMTYPDYAQARAAAGMRPEDSGIIPDAGARQKLRLQHGAQVDDGLNMLQTALQLDPDFSDAMAYINLLYRIRAAITDSDAESADLLAQANSWVSNALAAKARQVRNSQRASGALGADSPSNSMTASAPPPPPPPPPPPAAGTRAATALPPGGIRVEPAVQQAKLISQPEPAYPQEADRIGLSGVVLLNVVIARDGTVAQIDVVSGHPMLVPPAIEAVKQWTYQPTLLNGAPVDVATRVAVNFSRSGR